MRDFVDTLTTLLRNDKRGVTAVEYAIIAGVVALVIVVAFTSLGSSISTAINSVSTSV